LKELKKKINSFLWCNFNLRGDKGKGVGKLWLVTIRKPFYYQVKGIRLINVSLNEFD
jgi:hypothetical protein